ncbi:hypothetical protein ACFLRA_01835 [Bdellovibrionota bacterium]
MKKSDHCSLRCVSKYVAELNSMYNTFMVSSRLGHKSGKPFPGELIRSINKLLSATFGSKLKKEVFKIDGCSFGNELLLRVGIYDKAGGCKTAFEASIDHSSKEDIKSQINILLDGTGHFLGEYFLSRTRVVSADWNAVKMENAVFYIRQETKN